MSARTPTTLNSLKSVASFHGFALFLPVSQRCLPACIPPMTGINMDVTA